MYKQTDYPREREEALRRTAYIAMTKPSQAPSTSEKLRSIFDAPRSASQQRKPLFISESGDVPIGVIESMQRRHSELWGRY